MNDAVRWDPDQYARFAGERLRAGFELMARIGKLPPGDIVDLGCGAGEHAAALAERWPDRRVTGVDASPEMLGRARAAHPGLTWREGDLRTWAASKPLALVFSNAALHWVDDHAGRLARWMEMLAPGGTLAVQAPSNEDSAAHHAMVRICKENGWRGALDGLFGLDWVRPGAEYYDMLRGAGGVDVDVWETTYQHVLAAGGVTEWLKGTALRPILTTLSPGDGAAFVKLFDAATREAYPERADGATLYPQRRVFMVARRG